MTLFYIIRHGETDYNLTGQYQGQTDLPMNATGREQSAALARRFAAIPLDVIYSSDLVRALECARALAGGRPVAIDPRLREIDVGRVAHLTEQEIAQREPVFWRQLQQDWTQTRFPSGESAADVHRRALEAFRSYHERYPSGRVGVVTHGALISSLVADVLGIPLADRRRLTPSNCGLSVVHWTSEGRRLQSFNDTGHLPGLPAALRTGL